MPFEHPASELASESFYPRLLLGVGQASVWRKGLVGLTNRDLVGDNRTADVPEKRTEDPETSESPERSWRGGHDRCQLATKGREIGAGLG